MADSNGARLVTPVPDPTILTQEALEREIGAFAKVVEARFNAMDKAIVIQAHMIDLQPAINDKKIEHLRELHDEKFTSIQLQFTERDVRTEQTSRDSKVAVDAALQAAKEAVSEQNKSSALAIGKSDGATTKQIDTMGTLIQSTIGGINVMIGDLKERLTRIEGEGKGVSSQVSNSRMAGANVISIVGVVVGSLIGAAGLLTAFIQRPDTAPTPTAAAAAGPVAAPAPPQIIVVPFQPTGVATPPAAATAPR